MQYIMSADLLVIVMEIDCVRFMDLSAERLCLTVMFLLFFFFLDCNNLGHLKISLAFAFFSFWKIFSVVEFELNQISSSFLYLKTVIFLFH